MKEKINVFDYANDILKALTKGVLVTTKAENKTNAMVISWGMLGRQWDKPIFIVLARQNRFTKGQLDKNPEFTVNIPLGEMDKTIFTTCGTKSGRDIDKIETLGLTLIDGESVSVPAIKELPLTLECKVVYQEKQDVAGILPQYGARYYPQDVDSTYWGSNKDSHTVYYGEIVNAYIIKD